MKIATFLAIGPQIYVDGLVVIDKGGGGEKQQPVGRISSQHIISKILILGYLDWLELKASQIMDNFVGNIEMDSSLSTALEIFEKTRFAFVPIMAKDSSTTASLSIRDILPLIAKTNIDRPIKDLSSRLICVDKNTSIRTALDFMMKMGIRNIGVEDEEGKHDNNNNKLLYIINDRKILEFLLSHNAREVICRDGMAGLADIKINNHLDMTPVRNFLSLRSVSEIFQFFEGSFNLS